MPVTASAPATLQNLGYQFLTGPAVGFTASGVADSRLFVQAALRLTRLVTLCASPQCNRHGFSYRRRWYKPRGSQCHGTKCVRRGTSPLVGLLARESYWPPCRGSEKPIRGHPLIGCWPNVRRKKGPGAGMPMVMTRPAFIAPRSALPHEWYCRMIGVHNGPGNAAWDIQAIPPLVVRRCHLCVRCKPLRVPVRSSVDTVRCIVVRCGPRTNPAAYRWS